ncbi:MAG: hypothetical protein ACI909_003134 [Planctomycetota bacterium]|jgi:hypothetical protein
MFSVAGGRNWLITQLKIDWLEFSEIGWHIAWNFTKRNREQSFLTAKDMA